MTPSPIPEDRKSSGRWQPIETAPRDGNCVLLGSPADPSMDWPGIVDNCYWDGDFCGHGAWVLMSEGPCVARSPGLYTHWQPLPEPPAHSILSKPSQDAEP